MEQSLDDLLNGAFSDVSIGFLENENLDFDNVDFDNMCEEDARENQATEENEALHQEAAGEAAVLSNTGNKDMYVAENADDEQSEDRSDEEDFRGVGIGDVDQPPREDFTSSDTESEEESSDSGDDGREADTGTDEKPGGLLMSLRCSDEFSYDVKEDELFAVGQPVALEGGNEGQGESETQEQLLYFGQVPEEAKEMEIKGDGSEEEHVDDTSDSERERVEIRRDENLLALGSEHELESPYGAEASLEFSEASVQRGQLLSVEDDTEEDEGRMKDFSGEEHQEAGETFADYPSDFSSCEYVQGGRENPEKDKKAKSLSGPERAATDVTWTGKEEDADQEGDNCLYSRELEMDARGVVNVDAATQENGTTETQTMEHGGDDGAQTAESDSYSSSDDDDDGQESEDDTSLLEPENYKNVEFYSEAGAAVSGPSVSDDQRFTINPGNVADFTINWDFNFSSLLCEDLLTAAGTDSREDGKATHSSRQGSLDDSFFFNTEHVASGVAELGRLGDDEYEEERNWEQEKERIEAFYKFYADDAEENGREERQIKVQFCADPSQVIHYETDSSDRDSLSSSTEGEEDLSSEETSQEPREPDDTLPLKPVHDPPNTELPDGTEENDVSTAHVCTRKHKCGVILKQILKMGLVVLTGTLMFWLATDQADWFSQMSFF